MNFNPRKIKRYLPYLFFLFITLIFVSDLVFKGHVPIPTDIVVGHYYPWKDYVWQAKEAGFPLKNMDLIDVVTQLYPWRNFSIESFLKWEFPLWNPYNLTGLPHLANLPTASLYPLNFIFFITPFLQGWIIYLLLQIVLSSSFMYLYLRELKLSQLASTFGAVTFAFSSFMMMRFEYAISGHTFMWVPLTLLAIERYRKQGEYRWIYLGILSTTTMFLSGYLQTMLYGYAIIFYYAFVSLFKKKKGVWVFFALVILPILISSVQLLPFLDLVMQSKRLGGFEHVQATVGQYFLTPRRFVGFLAPDFYGNPSTGNHWETIVYAESAVYVGISTLAFAALSLFSVRNKKFYIWLSILTLSLLFITDNPIARLPYTVNIPGMSSLLPIRLTSVVNISLSVLAAFGLNSLLKAHNNKTHKIRFLNLSALLMYTIVALWLYLYMYSMEELHSEVENYVSVAMNNMILPTFYTLKLFAVSVLFLMIKKIKYKKILLVCLLLLTSFDLVRQAKKYNTFVPPEIVYPQTRSLQLLENITPAPRVMVEHPELMTANINQIYSIAMIDGYDSVHPGSLEDTLIALNYGGLSEIKNSPTRDLSLFNVSSKAINIVSPDYIYTFRDDLDDARFELVLVEGRTHLYKNTDSYPRVYLTKDLIVQNDERKALKELIEFAENGEFKAIIPYDLELSDEELNDVSSAKILSYSTNEVLIEVSSNTESLLVMNDSYDEGWKAMIGDEVHQLHKTNLAFRGIKVPAGEHVIKMKYQPKSFYLGLKITLVTIIIIIVIPFVNKKKLSYTNHS